VEACTITALDVTTAFAVPNPNGSSQSPSVFSGLVAPAGCPAEQITQLTSDWLNFNFEPTLSAVDGGQVKCSVDNCQCRFSVQTSISLQVRCRRSNLFYIAELRTVRFSRSQLFHILFTAIWNIPRLLTKASFSRMLVSKRLP
jgi:hypothetical protein